MKWSSVLFSSAVLIAVAVSQSSGGGGTPAIQFVFTSDAHYGITRAAFREGSNVEARVVNAALVKQINTLSSLVLPKDGGVRAGEPVGPVDFLVEGGDVANRSEVLDTGAIQSAATSWAQFKADYLDGLTLTDPRGARAAVYIVPGNHDVSNAIGFYRPMRPFVDKTMMVEAYNLMMAPTPRRTAATYEYPRDRVLTSRDLGGVHFVFLTVWPDSVARAWLDRDLQSVPPTTPVVVFAHDQPEGESKHFTNPNGAHDINPVDRFEDLLSDALVDGSTPEAVNLVEQEAWEGFVDRHPAIKAYFHGNANWNEFYDWNGPRHTVALHAFRADSPMKGRVSATDETKLSFQLAIIDTAAGRMTVRECLWNVDPGNPATPVRWGATSTVGLR
jgi:3',5'-cyclic AMP phosphodiesterase CpdA